ncbi:MAG: hypothetical protein QW728_06395, partial [Thermoplasmata archaeon]
MSRDEKQHEQGMQISQPQTDITLSNLTDTYLKHAAFLSSSLTIKDEETGRAVRCREHLETMKRMVDQKRFEAAEAELIEAYRIRYEKSPEWHFCRRSIIQIAMYIFLLEKFGQDCSAAKSMFEKAVSSISRWTIPLCRLQCEHAEEIIVNQAREFLKQYIKAAKVEFKLPEYEARNMQLHNESEDFANMDEKVLKEGIRELSSLCEISFGKGNYMAALLFANKIMKIMQLTQSCTELSWHFSQKGSDEHESKEIWHIPFGDWPSFPEVSELYGLAEWFERLILSGDMENKFLFTLSRDALQLSYQFLEDGLRLAALSELTFISGLFLINDAECSYIFGLLDRYRVFAECLFGQNLPEELKFGFLQAEISLEKLDADGIFTAVEYLKKTLLLLVDEALSFASKSSPASLTLTSGFEYRESLIVEEMDEKKDVEKYIDKSKSNDDANIEGYMKAEEAAKDNGKEAPVLFTPLVEDDGNRIIGQASTPEKQLEHEGITSLKAVAKILAEGEIPSPADAVVIRAAPYVKAWLASTTADTHSFNTGIDAEIETVEKIAKYLGDALKNLKESSRISSREEEAFMRMIKTSLTFARSGDMRTSLEGLQKVTNKISCHFSPDCATVSRQEKGELCLTMALGYAGLAFGGRDNMYFSTFIEEGRKRLWFSRLLLALGHTGDAVVEQNNAEVIISSLLKAAVDNSLKDMEDYLSKLRDGCTDLR